MSSPTELRLASDAATVHGLGDSGLGRDAIDRLLAAGHDLKVLTEAEQVGYLRWLYRKFDFDMRNRYIILVDGRSGRGEWRREAFLTKPAIDLLRQRHRIRLADVGCLDVRDGVVHTVRASMPGHRATEIQGFAPRCLPDGSVDAFAYAKARAAARRTAVRELAAMPLAAYEDLDPSRTSVVHTDIALGLAEGTPTPAVAGLPTTQPVRVSGSFGAADVDTARGLAPQFAGAGAGQAHTGEGASGIRTAGGLEVLEPLPDIGRQSAQSAPFEDGSEREGLARASARSARLADRDPRAVGAEVDVPRARPWDPRCEFADPRALAVLRHLAMRKLRTVHDERTYRHWLGAQTHRPFAERDPADLSGADVEALQRQLAPLPDVLGPGVSVGIDDLAEEPIADIRSLEMAAVTAASMAMAHGQASARVGLDER